MDKAKSTAYVMRTCEGCGESFYARKYDVNRGYGLYHSRECKRASKAIPEGFDNAKRYYNAEHKRWYRTWREPGSRKKKSMVEHRWVWIRHRGPIPPEMEVHHKDGNRDNNNLENLELLTEEEHLREHRFMAGRHKMLNGVECRLCSRCQQFKTLDHYGVKQGKNFQFYCKECYYEYSKGRREDESKGKSHSGGGRAFQPRGDRATRRVSRLFAKGNPKPRAKTRK